MNTCIKRDLFETNDDPVHRHITKLYAELMANTAVVNHNEIISFYEQIGQCHMCKRIYLGAIDKVLKS